PHPRGCRTGQRRPRSKGHGRLSARSFFARLPAARNFLNELSLASSTTMRKFVCCLGLTLPLLLLGAPSAAAQTSPTSATVTMTDSGFTPSGVTVQPGGSVTWINRSQYVHTATSVGGAPLAFTTGGVGPGETMSIGFGIPGNYYYTSSTDCQNG